MKHQKELAARVDSYKKLLMMKLLRNLDNDIETNISGLNTTVMISKSWQSVSTETIANCFRHAGLTFNEPIVSPSNADFDDEEPLSKWAEKLHSLQLSTEVINDFENIDNDVLTTADLTNEEIITSVLKEKQSSSRNDSDDSSNEDCEENDVRVPTMSKALIACDIIREFCNFNSFDGDQNFIFFEKLSDKLQKAYYFSRCEKQSKITDFPQKRGNLNN